MPALPWKKAFLSVFFDVFTAARFMFDGDGGIRYREDGNVNRDRTGYRTLEILYAANNQIVVIGLNMNCAI